MGKVGVCVGGGVLAHRDPQTVYLHQRPAPSETPAHPRGASHAGLFAEVPVNPGQSEDCPHPQATES